jgi:hypothetical protein
MVWLSFSIKIIEINIIFFHKDMENVLTRVLTPNDPVSQLMNKYKYEMMWSGVSQLFYHGEGAVEYFKHAVRGVLCERSTETDVACEWWACVLWSQAEWMGRGMFIITCNKLFYNKYFRRTRPCSIKTLQGCRLAVQASNGGSTMQSCVLYTFG